MHMHCPYCDATSVAGIGLVLLAGEPLVQCRCQRCGALFFAADRRGDRLLQLQDE